MVGLASSPTKTYCGNGHSKIVTYTLQQLLHYLIFYAQVMTLEQTKDSTLWKRERSASHSGAISRNYRGHNTCEACREDNVEQRLMRYYRPFGDDYCSSDDEDLFDDEELDQVDDIENKGSTNEDAVKPIVASMNKKTEVTLKTEIKNKSNVSEKRRLDKMNLEDICNRLFEEEGVFKDKSELVNKDKPCMNIKEDSTDEVKQGNNSNAIGNISIELNGNALSPVIPYEPQLLIHTPRIENIQSQKTANESKGTPAVEPLMLDEPSEEPTSIENQTIVKKISPVKLNKTKDNVQSRNETEFQNEKNQNKTALNIILGELEICEEQIAEEKKLNSEIALNTVRLRNMFSGIKTPANRYMKTRPKNTQDNGSDETHNKQEVVTSLADVKMTRCKTDLVDQEYKRHQMIVEHYKTLNLGVEIKNIQVQSGKKVSSHKLNPEISLNSEKSPDLSNQNRLIKDEDNKYKTTDLDKLIDQLDKGIDNVNKLDSKTTMVKNKLVQKRKLFCSPDILNQIEISPFCMGETLINKRAEVLEKSTEVSTSIDIDTKDYLISNVQSNSDETSFGIKLTDSTQDINTQKNRVKETVSISKTSSEGNQLDTEMSQNLEINKLEFLPQCKEQNDCSRIDNIEAAWDNDTLLIQNFKEPNRCSKTILVENNLEKFLSPMQEPIDETPEKIKNNSSSFNHNMQQYSDEILTSLDLNSNITADFKENVNFETNDNVSKTFRNSNADKRNKLSAVQDTQQTMSHTEEGNLKNGGYSSTKRCVSKIKQGQQHETGSNQNTNYVFLKFPAQRKELKVLTPLNFQFLKEMKEEQARLSKRLEAKFGYQKDTVGKGGVSILGISTDDEASAGVGMDRNIDKNLSESRDKETSNEYTKSYEYAAVDIRKANDKMCEEERGNSPKDDDKEKLTNNVVCVKNNNTPEEMDRLCDGNNNEVKGNLKKDGNAEENLIIFNQRESNKVIEDTAVETETFAIMNCNMDVPESDQVVTTIGSNHETRNEHTEDKREPCPILEEEDDINKVQLLTLNETEANELELGGNITAEPSFVIEKQPSNELVPFPMTDNSLTEYSSVKNLIHSVSEMKNEVITLRKKVDNLELHISNKRKVQDEELMSLNRGKFARIEESCSQNNDCSNDTNDEIIILKEKIVTRYNVQMIRCSKVNGVTDSNAPFIPNKRIKIEKISDNNDTSIISDDSLNVQPEHLEKIDDTTQTQSYHLREQNSQGRQLPFAVNEPCKLSKCTQHSQKRSSTTQISINLREDPDNKEKYLHLKIRKIRQSHVKNS